MVRRIEALVPMEHYAPPWRGSAFLLYAGSFVALAAGLGLLAALGNDGAGELAGWSALVLALTLGAALGLERAERHVLAGLAAFLAVVFFAVLFGAVESWIGFFPDAEAGPDFQPEFEPSVILLGLATIAAGIAALRRFRFPLIGLLIAVTFAFLVVDQDTVFAGSDAGNGTRSVLAVIAGAVLVALGLALDRDGRPAYGFWFHAVGAAAIGSGILQLAEHGGWGWTVIGLASLGYVAVAVATGRSVWAVLGAIGVVATGTYAIADWLGLVGFVPFFGELSDAAEPWQLALAYVVVGLILILLGLLVRSREEPYLAPAESTVPPE